MRTNHSQKRVNDGNHPASKPLVKRIEEDETLMNKL